MTNPARPDGDAPKHDEVWKRFWRIERDRYEELLASAIAAHDKTPDEIAQMVTAEWCKSGDKRNSRDLMRRAVEIAFVSRATSPARDAAEGARRSQGLCDTTLTERFINPACRCDTYVGNPGPCKTFLLGPEGACSYCDHDETCHRAAPPKPAPNARPDLAEVDGAIRKAFSKPAPDAVLDAVKRLLEYARMRIRAGDDKPSIDEDIELVCKATFAAPVPPAQEIESESMFHDRMSDGAAALRHAPVPPADGAGEPIGWIVRIKDVKCFYWERGVAEWKASEFEDQHGATATIDPVFLRSPSATGAAEPMALAREIENAWDNEPTPFNRADVAVRVILSRATPPVRGDREEIPSVAPNACACCGGELHLNGAHYSCDRGTSESFHVDDLSLPVQPGAGEREAVDVPRFMETVRSQWNFEENEFDAIEKVISDPKCVAALSLQPPQSSSDGEGR